MVIEVEFHALWRSIIEMEELGVAGGTLEGGSKVIAYWASGSLSLNLSR